jgi:hypothetical protein
VILIKELHMLAAMYTSTSIVVRHVPHPLLALAILAMLGVAFMGLVIAATIVILHYGRK